MRFLFTLDTILFYNWLGNREVVWLPLYGFGGCRENEFRIFYTGYNFEFQIFCYIFRCITTLVPLSNFNMSTEICAMCLDEMKGYNHQWRPFLCDHWFHFECIEKLLRTHEGCPFCSVMVTGVVRRRKADPFVCSRTRKLTQITPEKLFDRLTIRQHEKATKELPSTRTHDHTFLAYIYDNRSIVFVLPFALLAVLLVNLYYWLLFCDTQYRRRY